jgi:two-component sensor histidine kinase
LETVSVRKVLNVELAPYVGGRVSLHCDNLTVEASAGVNLSLIVHELLTNALKYGPLSSLGGHLDVACRGVEGGAALVWTETTAAKIGTPGAPGFGTQLIQRLASALRGSITTDWRPTGLRVVVAFAASPADGDIQASPKVHPND